MAAAYQNLYLEQGTTFGASIVLDDVNGNIYDLRNTSAVSQIRKSYYSSNATAHFATSIDPTTGMITLSLDAQSSANIAPGRYVYDTIITIGSTINTPNTVIRVLEGIIDVSPSVTR